MDSLVAKKTKTPAARFWNYTRECVVSADKYPLSCKIVEFQGGLTVINEGPDFFARYFSQQSCLMVLNRTDWCEFAEFSCNTGDYIHSHFFFITVELCFSGLFLSLKRIGQFSSILLQSGPVGIICLLWSSLSCLTPLISFLSFQVDFFNLWRHLWAFFSSFF